MYLKVFGNYMHVVIYFIFNNVILGTIDLTYWYWMEH